MSGVSVEEFMVLAGAPCAGKRVKEIAWPREAVIASLRRGRLVLVPDGGTVLRAGDVLVVVAESAAQAELRRLCAPSATPLERPASP
jgi:CIC family chloride channel protein